MFQQTSSSVNSKTELEKYIDEQIGNTQFRQDISADTKIICHWLYIIAKVISIALIK